MTREVENKSTVPKDRHHVSRICIVYLILGRPKGEEEFD